MNEANVGLKSNLTKVDAHTITHEEYEEIPELPQEFFTDGQLFAHGQPIAHRARGKQKRPVKEQLTLRFDADIVAAFRTTGPGWQTRMNNALRQWLKENRS
ncbi:MAG: BrnA antitoxin family protein [bacterium]|nr:BrnA antitoxin family protein [bacterium]